MPFWQIGGTMLTLSLNAANTVVSAIGCVTADTVTGGAASAIGAGFSIKDIIQKLKGETPFHKRVANDLDAERNRHVLSGDQAILLDQMLAATRIDPAEVIACGRNATAIVTVMLRHLTDSSHKTHAAEDTFRRVVTPVLERYLADATLSNDFRPAFEDAVIRGMVEIRTQVTFLADQFAEMGRKLGLQEGMIIQLARVYAPGESRDFATAIRNIEAALKVADETNRAAQLPRNTDDAVRAVLQRVAALNKVGHFDAGQAELDDALARLQVERATLLDQAASQARLRNDPATGARHIVDRLRIDRPDSLVSAITEAQEAAYVSGRGSGSRFDLLLSLELARLLLGVSKLEIERCSALIRIGTALTVLGEQSGDRAFVERSITEIEEAEKLVSKETHPMHWGLCKINIGNSKLILGKWLGQTEILWDASTSSRAALEVFSESFYPQFMVNALLNATAAESVIAGISKSFSLLRTIISDLERARTIDQNFPDSDFTIPILCNLSDGLIEMFRLRPSESLLTKGEAVIELACSIAEQRGSSYERAKAALNKGAFRLSHFGLRKNEVHLGEAAKALDYALGLMKENQSDPLYALVLENRAEAYFLSANRYHGKEREQGLTAALECIDAALTVYNSIQMPYDHAKATALRADILAALA